MLGGLGGACLALCCVSGAWSSAWHMGGAQRNALCCHRPVGTAQAEEKGSLDSCSRSFCNQSSVHLDLGLGSVLLQGL
jgi:hypothetical protein